MLHVATEVGVAPVPVVAIPHVLVVAAPVLVVFVGVDGVDGIDHGKINVPSHHPPPHPALLL